MRPKEKISSAEPRSSRTIAPGVCLRLRFTTLLLVAILAPCLAVRAAEPFTAPPPSHRPVLVTTFHLSTCLPCYGVAKALTRLQSEYSRDEVLVLTLHVGDEYALPFGETLFESYNSTGIPLTLSNHSQAYVGGRSATEGEAGVQAMYDVLKVFIQNEQAFPYYTAVPRFRLQLAGSVAPVNPSLELTITAEASYPDPVLVYFIIVEDEVPVQASNGQTTLDGLARIVLDVQQADLSVAGTIVTLTASFNGTIPFADASKLHPLIYIDNSITNEVLDIKGLFDHNAVAEWTEYE